MNIVCATLIILLTLDFLICEMGIRILLYLSHIKLIYMDNSSYDKAPLKYHFKEWDIIVEKGDIIKAVFFP